MDNKKDIGIIIKRLLREYDPKENEEKLGKMILSFINKRIDNQTYNVVKKINGYFIKDHEGNTLMIYYPFEMLLEISTSYRDELSRIFGVDEFLITQYIKDFIEMKFDERPKKIRMFF